MARTTITRTSAPTAIRTMRLEPPPPLEAPPPSQGCSGHDPESVAGLVPLTCPVANRLNSAVLAEMSGAARNSPVLLGYPEPEGSLPTYRASRSDMIKTVADRTAQNRLISAGRSSVIVSCSAPAARPAAPPAGTGRSNSWSARRTARPRSAPRPARSASCPTP